MADLVSIYPLAALSGGLLGSVIVMPLLMLLASTLRLIAQPNARSSHTRPTPTGGGVAIALPVVIWCAFAPVPFGQQLAIGAGLLALVGLLDDMFDLSALLRFVVQIGVVTWFVTVAWPDGGALWQLTVGLGMLWFVNLFNFMDGIDGIAGSQAILYCVGVTLLTGAMLTWLESLVWMIAGSCLGFLFFNWPPARMFMGDAGALLLGLCLPALAIELDRGGYVPLGASLVLLSVFVFDATWTLSVRIITRQRFTSAHRSHLYQRLASAYGHLYTTAGFVAYVSLYLWPLAWLVTHRELGAGWALAAAIGPLVLLSFRYSSGMTSARAASSDLPNREVDT